MTSGSRSRHGKIFGVIFLVAASVVFVKSQFNVGDGKRSKERQGRLSGDDWSNVKYWPDSLDLPVKHEDTFHQCQAVGFGQPDVSAASYKATAMCSLRVFKDYYKEKHNFPGGGQWCRNKTSDDIRPQFVPSMCKYAYSEIPTEPLTRCLAAKNIRKIVTMGDSQGGRHYAAMYGEISKAMDNCEIIKAEHKGKLEINLDRTYLVRTNWTHYDKANLPSEEIKDYGCRVCIGMLRRCTYTVNNKQHVLYLEHLRMSKQQSGSPYLKYLFTNYLTRDIEPDFVIIWPPVNHLKNGPSLTFSRLVSYVTDLILANLNSTQLIWVPGAREVEVNKPEKYKNVLYTGSISTKKIIELNKRLYQKTVEHLENPEGRVHGFWDMVNISRDGWNTDGVHFLPIWYTRVQQLLLQTLCAP